MAHHDTIILGTQTFPIRGKITSAPVSEFESGVKVGPVNYDHREHAQFITLNDWTGGFGERRLDVREALGQYWYGDPDGTPDTSFSGRVTLSLKQTRVVIPDSPAYLLPGSVSRPHEEVLGGIVFGLGSAIYKLTGPGIAPTKVLEGGTVSRITAIIPATEKKADTRRLYACWGPGSLKYPYMSTDYGNTWNQIHPKWLVHQGETVTNGSVIGFTSATFGEGDEPIDDLFFWDNKVIGAYNWLLEFLVPDSQTIVSYQILVDPVTGLGVPIYLNPGQEPWNRQIPLDAQYLATGTHMQVLNFVGVAQGPSGEPSVYLRAGANLYVLDFFARKLNPVDMSLGSPLTSGTMFNGAVTLSDGWNVYEYNPGGGTVRNVGFPKKWGIPPNLQNGTGDGAQDIVYLIPSDDFLYAVVVDISVAAHPTTTLYRYNGTGWNQIGAIMRDFMAYYGFHIVFPVTYETSFGGDITRHIILPGSEGPYTGGSSIPSPPVAYYQFDLPNLTQQPTPGRDVVGLSGQTFYTGWMDCGFQDLFGTLLRMDVDGWNLTSTETVRIDYRLDNDETASWQQMTDASGVPALFNGTNVSLYFTGDGALIGGPGTYSKRGRKFRTVQFRIQLNRDPADNTKTPELQALTLVYLKTPELRLSWAFNIDVGLMVQAGKGEAGDEEFYVDSAPATLESVWNKLQSLWTNNHYLVRFIVPNVHPSPGRNVKITQMPLTFDDFRDAVAGNAGVCAVQVLEPVEP